jgi:sugar lactone lactonase YvrE
LTGDDQGNLYTTGRAFAHNNNVMATGPNPPLDSPCPVWRINIAPGTLLASVTQIGTIPNPPNNGVSTPSGFVATASCNPSGITFDAVGNLYIADADTQLGGVVWRLIRNPDGTYMSPASVADAYATNVPGTNALAFDRDGNLWTGDGTTGLGRVWRISPSGVVTEVFRIQPMNNSMSFGGDVVNPGVGRANATIPGSPQNLVANGIAFNQQGDMFVIDTARGALWQVQFDRQGNLLSPTMCDHTFTDNTLCLSNVFVAHPIIEGGDGIALDVAGNIWVDANERNAVAVVTKNGSVVEIFRNSINPSSNLRNAGDPVVANSNKHILEFPTSPFISGTRFCTSNSDGNRRDNSPNAVGEINSSRPLENMDIGQRAKISCMTDPNTGNLIGLNIPGMPLPVH